MGKIIKQAKGKFDSLSEGLRALMYAISLAAITSLDEIEVRKPPPVDGRLMLIYHRCKKISTKAKSP
jgi:hypothetical protein